MLFSAIRSAPRLKSPDEIGTYDKILMSIGNPRVKNILQILQFVIPYKLTRKIIDAAESIRARDAEDLSTIMRRELTGVAYNLI